MLGSPIQERGIWNHSHFFCVFCLVLWDPLWKVFSSFKSRDRQDKLPHFNYILQINVLNLAPSSPAVAWSIETASRK